MTLRINKIYLAFIVILLLSAFSYSEGIWVESALSVTGSCSPTAFVMCAEKDLAGTVYTPDITPGAEGGVIAYHDENANLAQKTNQFCAIVTDSTLSTNFEFVNGSDVGVTSLSELKIYPNLAQESPSAKSYAFEAERHYDENCDADEIFERNSNRLILNRYIENYVSYDVEESSNFGNLDNFDIIAEVAGGGKLGGALYGDVTDDYGAVKGVNVTLYFNNKKGTFKPYRSYLTGDDGNYTTLNDVTLVTNYRTIVTNRIPLTNYIVIAKHEGYHDYIGEVSLNYSNPFVNLNISLTPLDYCQDDCTFVGDDLGLCRKECNGVNGCEFKAINTVYNSTFAANQLHLVPSMSSDKSIQISVEGSNYSVSPCEGAWFPLTFDDISKVNSQCPDGQEAWKTSRVVKLDGKIVRMVVTLCR